MPGGTLTSPGTVLDGLPVGVADMTADGRLRNLNATLRDWLGLVGDSVLLADLLPPAARIYLETHLRPLLAMQGEFSEVALDLRRADGTTVGVTAYARATEDGSARLVFAPAEQRRAYELELMAKRVESERFAATVRSSPEAIVILSDDRRIEAWNQAATDLFGWTEAEAMGRDLKALIVPEGEAALSDEAEASLAAEGAIRDEVRRVRRDGTVVEVRRSVAAVRDQMGRALGRVVTFADVSERKQAEARVAVLIEELSHRTKNLIAVVGVIARQSARGHAVDGFLDVFMSRLQAVVRNQDLLAAGESDGTDLATLVRAQIAHLGPATSIDVAGPPIAVGPRAAQALGMAFYELGTNAAKYGALATPDGCVRVRWTAEGGRMTLDWTERGGPPVEPPQGQGFGSRVTGPLLEMAMGGQAARTWDAAGMNWRLVADLARLGI